MQERLAKVPEATTTYMEDGATYRKAYLESGDAVWIPATLVPEFPPLVDIHLRLEVVVKAPLNLVPK